MLKWEKIVDARADSDRDITAARFADSTTCTPLETAIRMAKHGQIENVHVSHTREG